MMITPHLHHNTSTLITFIVHSDCIYITFSFSYITIVYLLHCHILHRHLQLGFHHKKKYVLSGSKFMVCPETRLHELELPTGYIQNEMLIVEKCKVRYHNKAVVLLDLDYYADEGSGRFCNQNYNYQGGLFLCTL